MRTLGITGVEWKSRLHMIPMELHADDLVRSENEVFRASENSQHETLPLLRLTPDVIQKASRRMTEGIGLVFFTNPATAIREKLPEKKLDGNDLDSLATGFYSTSVLSVACEYASTNRSLFGLEETKQLCRLQPQYQMGNSRVPLKAHIDFYNEVVVTGNGYAWNLCTKEEFADVVVWGPDDSGAAYPSGLEQEESRLWVNEDALQPYIIPDQTPEEKQLMVLENFRVPHSVGKHGGEQARQLASIDILVEPFSGEYDPEEKGSKIWVPEDIDDFITRRNFLLSGRACHLEL